MHIMNSMVQNKEGLQMEEKIYNTMKRSGGMNITLGILMIVFGLTAGVLMIVTGGRLLVKKADILLNEEDEDA